MSNEPSAIGTLSSPPMADQVVRHAGKEYDTVKEGLAYILTPRTEGKQKGGGGVEARQSVFYNPIQQFNRDLSVLAIRAYGEHAMAVKQMKRERKLKQKEEEKVKRGLKRKREEGDQPKNEAKKADTGEKIADAATEGPVNGAEPNATEVDSGANTTATSQEWKPSFTVLDALSASGLRALRYAKEIPYVTRVVANDLSSTAIESMKLNIQHNGVGHLVHPNNGDACSLMYSAINPQRQSKDGSWFGRYDVVDLDPYGTAAPFLDAAVQAVCDGGLLCVTCTDAGVFAAVGYPEKSFSLYGGVSIKGPQSHEAGLRLILNALAMSAAKYGLAIEPLLSLSIDFYARIFVRVHKSPSEVKFTAGKTMFVYTCDSGCGAWKTQTIAVNRKREGKNGVPYYHHGLAQAPTASPTCEHCGTKTHLAGPMWAGPLHNPHFIQRILDLLPGADRETYPTVDRIEGMLVTALEEDLELGSGSKSGDATPDPERKSATSGSDKNSDPSSYLIPRVDPAKIEPYPFFFMPSFLCKVLHTQTIPEDSLRGALRHVGYRSTRSHAKPNSVRTDAPWEVIWEIMREWVRQKSPVRADKIRPGSPGDVILNRKLAPSTGSKSGAGQGDADADGPGAGLRALKRDILEAVESGRDLADLTTKIEAALYRSGAKRPQTATATATASTSGSTPAAAEQQVVAASDAQAETESSEPQFFRPGPSKLDIVFDETLGRTAMAAHRKKRLVRYQVNPRPNWGPLTRAPVGNPRVKSSEK
ncbi:hypothetical protein VTO42DRAFT_6942 [Malbranchea cinnamomea]